MNDATEPYCNHDAPAVRNGRCECGAIVNEHTERLEELRATIRDERISMSELVELQGMADQIDPGDVELLEWAGVPEFPEAEELAFGVDQMADGTPVGLWFAPGIIENDEYDRAFIGLDGLRELREQINEALTGW